MTARRPTAADRDLADAVRLLFANGDLAYLSINAQNVYLDSYKEGDPLFAGNASGFPDPSIGDEFGTWAYVTGDTLLDVLLALAKKHAAVAARRAAIVAARRESADLVS